MYSRIRLNAADRHYHRFMWPEEDGSITTCEMTRVMFGVSCSPFVSIRTMWRVAEDSGPELKGATEAIQNCFYVDDYLGSARSTEEAVTVTTTVSRALSSGDFHLGGWASNDPAVLDAIQPACRVKEKMDGGAQDLGADELETVLGITWRPSSDQLGFRVKEKEVIFTRVGLASMVAGQFDPQGTAAPMTIKGKIRLRELGVRGLDWTESVMKRTANGGRNISRPFNNSKTLSSRAVCLKRKKTSSVQSCTRSPMPRRKHVLPFVISATATRMAE
jgi:hypothetical protein